MTSRTRGAGFVSGLMITIAALLIVLPGRALAEQTPVTPGPPVAATPALRTPAPGAPTPTQVPVTPDQAPTSPSAQAASVTPAPTPGQVSPVPVGAADTGGGSTAGAVPPPLVGAGLLVGLAVLAAAFAGVRRGRRRVRA